MIIMEPKPIATPEIHDRVMKIFENYRLDKNSRILDAACGEGALLNELYKKGYSKLYGVDIEENRFAIKNRAKFKKADLNNKVPFNNSTFEFIFSLETLEHLDSPYNAIKEFHRVLKKNGALIISIPNLNNWYQKLYFLFTGGFLGFFCAEPAKKIHVSPVFLWYMKKLLHGKFMIKNIYYHRPLIPLLRVQVPLNNIFFCESCIIECAKI